MKTPRGFPDIQAVDADQNKWTRATVRGLEVRPQEEMR